MTNFLQERLISIVRNFGDQRILVVGDAIADQFVYGAISRVSREAPVFILRHEHTETVPGGAANCALNLSSLGARVQLVGVVGDDAPGRALIEKLELAGVDCSSVVRAPDLQTTTKVRILAGQLHSTRQQVIRLDYDGNAVHRPEVLKRLRGSIDDLGKSCDAIIISDYNYGVANEDLARAVRDVASNSDIPVIVDSRFRLSDFSGFTSGTPNEDEVEQLLGKRLTTDAELEEASEQIRKQLGYQALLVTRGSQGMLLFEEGAGPVSLEAVGAREPVDVTGAGDTVIAVYALAIATNSSFSDAAHLANYAGGIVVMKRGTATVTANELRHTITHSEDN